MLIKPCSDSILLKKQTKKPKLHNVTLVNADGYKGTAMKFNMWRASPYTTTFRYI